MSMRYKGGFLTNNPPSTSGTAYTGVASGMWTLQEAMDAVKANLWPKAQGTPDAPTIGTATVGTANHGVISITFTPPVDTGGSAITSYTVISFPGGYTATGTSSPILTSDIPRLLDSTTYTFTVRANNAAGSGPFSAASNTVNPALTIGQAYGGGYFVGFINHTLSPTTQGAATHRLIVSDKSVGAAYNLRWGPVGINTAATSLYDGATNTTVMAGYGTSYEAATFCQNLSSGGYTDWYMPSCNELEICYYNLKPTTNPNDYGTSGGGFGGRNVNSVAPEPFNNPYTFSGSPAINPSMTTSVKFRANSLQQWLDEAWQWTSTQYDANNARTQMFVSGYQTYFAKSQQPSSPTRAIRKELISVVVP